MYKAIIDLLDFSELTHSRKEGTYIMNKWSSKKKDYQIKNVYGIVFVTIGLVEESSGNLETKETHYIIKHPRGKFNKIENIDYLLNGFNKNYEKNSYQDEVIQTLLKIRDIELRKIKIKKICSRKEIK